MCALVGVCLIVVSTTSSHGVPCRHPVKACNGLKRATHVYNVKQAGTETRYECPGTTCMRYTPFFIALAQARGRR